MVDNVAEKGRAGGKIKEVIALCIALFVDLGQDFSDSGVESRIMKFASRIENTLDHPITKLRINRACGELIKIVTHDLLILLAGVIVAAHADDREVRREQLALNQVIDGREELARSKVTSSAKNDHHTRTCRRWRA